ncbi:predicted protein [Nematostella vectensis]|uniref:Rhodanese domain-containing protein n=1 Tax=Nematostella vectensis TaxID=45351 RepID=A7SQG5_NEMVE|nr:predicted protein [Nematostella vectensis]|eukprot:XP_001626176.1 predicted protein [Nematostella vectensis]
MIAKNLSRFLRRSNLPFYARHIPHTGQLIYTTPTMKSSQIIRNLSLFALLVFNRIRSSGASVNCTTMTPRQRFTHMLGVTERGQCACAKRTITSTIPIKDPETEVSIEELQLLIKQQAIQLFDVREPYELEESGKIPFSINIPLRQVPEAFTMKPKEFKLKYGAKKPKRKDTDIVFHCKAGIRSKTALKAVRSMGFRKAKHYPGGFDEWETCIKRGGAV